MVRAIHFDHQPRRRCIEIDNVADGFLPIELNAEDLFSSQATPQSLFRVGKVRS
jgi:hypothetical protein